VPPDRNVRIRTLGENLYVHSKSSEKMPRPNASQICPLFTRATLACQDCAVKRYHDNQFKTLSRLDEQLSPKVKTPTPDSKVKQNMRETGLFRFIAVKQNLLRGLALKY
jgi:hypothetical protein